MDSSPTKRRRTDGDDSVWSHAAIDAIVETAFWTSSQEPELDLKPYRSDDFNLEDCVKVLAGNFEWHNRLLGLKGGRLDGDTSKLVDQENALKRCLVAQDDAEFLWNAYNQEEVKTAVKKIVKKAYDSERKLRDAIVSLALIGSRFGWSNFEQTYLHDIGILEVDSWSEEVTQNCERILHKAHKVLCVLADGAFGPGPDIALPGLIPVKTMKNINAFVGLGGIFVNSGYATLQHLVKSRDSVKKQLADLMLFRLFLHELAHYYARKAERDVNLHSPLKMNLTKPMAMAYEAKNQLAPQGPERGCVCERCAFCCRPNFESLIRIPVCLRDLVAYIAADEKENIPRPTFPIDLSKIHSITTREDQTTGLDMVNSDLRLE